jgi:hypothetical protein
MHPKPRTLFWIESALASLAVALAAVTLVWRDWIEWVFGVDPDQHSGYAEWLLVGALLTVAVALALLAGRELRAWRVGRSAPEPG